MGNEQFRKEKNKNVSISLKKQKSAWSCMNQESALDQYEFNIGMNFKQPKGKITANSIANLSSEEINFLKACGNRNVSAIRYYIQNGVSVNILDEERTSPLHVAVRRGSEQIIEELIFHGANVNITDLDGLVLNSFACCNKFFKTFCLLTLVKVWSRSSVYQQIRINFI